jgi:hypothetical protein
MILPTTNINVNNQWFGTDGGRDTTDKIFLLSIEEVVKYFGDSGQLKNRPGDSWWIDDTFSKERVATYGGKAWWWWLRSPGLIGDFAAGVGPGGGLDVCGFDVYDAEGGVRPALWLNLKS